MTEINLFDIADNYFTVMRKAEDNKNYDAFMEPCDFRDEEPLLKKSSWKSLTK